MNFEQYLIPNIPASEGFIGSLISIPVSEIQRNNSKEVIQEIGALEAYADAILSNLHSDIAMESSGSGDKLSSIAAKAKMAGQKMKEGKSTNNPNLVAQGSNELSASMQELNSESRNAKDPKSKAKVWMVAKVIGAVVASVLLVFGAVTAGKALSSGVKSKDTSGLSNGSKQAKKNLSSDPILRQMNKQTADLEAMQKQQAVNKANLDKLTADMERTAQAAADLQKSVQQAKNEVKIDSSFMGLSPEERSKKIDEAMRSGKTISFESYTAVDLSLLALEAMIEIESADLTMMNFAAMEATGNDSIDSASVEIVDRAKDAYDKLKSASTDAEKAGAYMELDSVSKDMITESNRAKDPGSKARWKKVAKIIGGIAASVALIGGAVALYNTIKSKNANTNPIQAAASMKQATAASSSKKTNTAKDEPKSTPHSNTNTINSTNSSTRSTTQTASSTSSAESKEANLTYTQKQEIESLKQEIDNLKKRRKDIINANSGKQIDSTDVEKQDVHKQLADLTNSRNAVKKKLLKLYGVHYG